MRIYPRFLRLIGPPAQVRSLAAILLRPFAFLTREAFELLTAMVAGVAGSAAAVFTSVQVRVPPAPRLGSEQRHVGVYYNGVMTDFLAR